MSAGTCELGGGTKTDLAVWAAVRVDMDFALLLGDHSLKIVDNLGQSVDIRWSLKLLIR
jgi:hypothetical protein